MAQYATVILRTRSKNAPDFGLGQGVIASKLVKLSDDDGMAGIQMHEVWEDMVNENLKMDYEEATKEDWIRADDDYKTEQEKFVEYLQTVYPDECEEGMGYSLEPEETRGDRLWYKEHYKVPEDIEWIGQQVHGVGMWTDTVFLFNPNNEFIGYAIEIPTNNRNEYKFEKSTIKEIIGEQDYKEYFEKE